MGELEVAELSHDDATRLTMEIKLDLESAWDKVVLAYEGRAWKALDYPSWDAYCKAEFAATRLRLPNEDRDQRIVSLAAQGLSQRAIAGAIGTGVRHVNNALREERSRQRERNRAEVFPEETPDAEPERSTGTDGKSYQRWRSEPDVVEAVIVNEEEDGVPGTAAKRPPLTNLFRSPVTAIGKAAQKISTLSGDDRMTRNRQVMAELYLGEVRIAHQQLSEFLTYLERGAEKANAAR